VQLAARSRRARTTRSQALSRLATRRAWRGGLLEPRHLELPRVRVGRREILDAPRDCGRRARRDRRFMRFLDRALEAPSGLGLAAAKPMLTSRAISEPGAVAKTRQWIRLRNLIETASLDEAHSCHALDAHGRATRRISPLTGPGAKGTGHSVPPGRQARCPAVPNQGTTRTQVEPSRWTRSSLDSGLPPIEVRRSIGRSLISRGRSLRAVNCRPETLYLRSVSSLRTSTSAR